MIAMFLLSASCPAFGQTGSVSGTVTDVAGEPLIGVNVLVKGTTNGVITDIDGKYSLQQVPASATLTFSYVGYIAQEVVVGSQRTINIQLRDDTQRLEEVVVVGYGTQQKRDITGSVAVVDTKELLKSTGSSAAQQLQGKAAGVYIGTSGAPGAATMVRIRGVNTINDNGPLYVIDGVSSRNQDLSSLNPSDIESLQVLKDASAAAIYGAQAANGVILITTKKGTNSGQPVLTYDVYFGVQQPGKRYDVLSSEDRMKLEWVGKANALKLSGAWEEGVRPDHDIFKSGADGFSPYKYLSNAGGGLDNINMDAYSYPGNIYAEYSDTNWWDEVTNEYAPMQNHQLGLSGGTDKGQYNISLGYFDQSSVHLHRYYTRYSTRMNSSFNIRPWLRMGENISFARWKDLGRVNDTSEASIYSWTYRASPWIPVYDLANNFAGSIIPGTGNWQNPVSLLVRDKDNYYTNTRLFGNIWAEADLMKNLSFRTSFGLDYTNRYSYRMAKKNLEFSESSKQNNLEEQAGFNYRWVWSNTITYNAVLNDVHRIKVLLGTEAIRDGMGRSMTAQRYNYTDILEQFPNTWVLNLGENNDQRIANSSYNAEFALFGVFGRVDYSFQDKYLITVNVRRDGVSRFSSSNRYGTFPSLSLGWRLSEEAFMAATRDWLTDLKLRAGYGQVGNAELPRSTNFAYEYILEPTRSNYDIAGSNGGTTGFRLNRFGNEDTKWEAVETYNLGIDATILNKFTVGVEAYSKKTTNMLLPAAYSGMSGEASAPFINFGDMKNTGFDANISYHDSKGDLSWDVALNLSHYKNEVLKISNADDYAIWRGGARLNGDITRTIKGHAISEFYGYQVDGFYESTAEVNSRLPLGVSAKLSEKDAAKWVGKFKFADLNGDGKLNSSDRTVIGSPHPDLIAGLNLGLNYKNWDFTMFWYSTIGNDLFNNTLAFTDFQLFRGNRSSRMRDLSWEPGKSSAILPIIDADDSYSLNTNSYFVEDASFLRLKNLVVGYSFPKPLLKKATISNLRLYFQMENTLTITGYRGLDPELTNADVNEGNNADLRRGLDMGAWPNIMRFTLGVNFAF
ncbi:MAG: TonB-dependent receptor [Tannerellaceae bacterium]|nr:TonB-dependent receptor [Tannerellaceae bacterium]